MSKFEILYLAVKCRSRPNCFYRHKIYFLIQSNFTEKFNSIWFDKYNIVNDICILMICLPLSLEFILSKIGNRDLCSCVLPVFTFVQLLCMSVFW